MFEGSHLLGIPLLVFSAGIGDIIDGVLIRHFSQYYVPENPFYPIEHLPQLKSPGSTLPITSHLPTSPAEYGAQMGIPKTIYIIANHLDFEQDLTVQDLPPKLLPHKPSTFSPSDLVSGFRANAPIHVFNKHEALVMTAPYYETQIYPRKNAIVLGDSLGDALMVAKDSTDNVIRIGFLQTNEKHNKTKKTHLAKYLDSFDIVFVDNDDGIGLVNQILDFFTNNSSSTTEAKADTNRSVVFESTDGGVDAALEKILTGVQVFAPHHIE